MTTHPSDETEDEVAAALERFTDNFDRQVANPLVDLIDVTGDKDFTPERLRFFKDGSPVFLQYGTDPTYSETNQGHLLQPGSDQSLTIRTAEKAAYQVGFDLWPTMSRSINQAPQTGDVVGGGYGEIDIQNFDPANVTYSGSTADGYFWYHTADTGLDQVLLAMVENGTVRDSRTVDLVRGADTPSIIEQRLNWYAVGPCIFRQTDTDIANDILDPQRNETIGAVANDDGFGPASGSHRVTMAVYQASGNSGLELEAGSMGIRAPGPVSPQFKAKAHTMTLTVTDATADTYQVCGAIRVDPNRETVKLRFTDLAIVSTPGSSVTTSEVLITSVQPENTDADDKTFETPREHNDANSVLREVEDNTTQGPIEDDPGTDATGATTGNTMSDPGGYQLAHASVTTEGTGATTSIAEVGGEGNREVYPGDIALVLADSDSTGDIQLDIITEQNS